MYNYIISYSCDNLQYYVNVVQPTVLDSDDALNACNNNYSHRFKKSAPITILFISFVGMSEVSTEDYDY